MLLTYFFGLKYFCTISWSISWPDFKRESPRPPPWGVYTPQTPLKEGPSVRDAVKIKNCPVGVKNSRLSYSPTISHSCWVWTDDPDYSVSDCMGGPNRVVYEMKTWQQLNQFQPYPIISLFKESFGLFETYNWIILYFSN